MFGKSTIFAALSALSLVAAQNTPAQNGTDSSQVMVHVIQVGNADGDLTFNPEVTSAKVGDKIQFQFYPRNHSIAQSSFDSPCSPLAQSATTGAGFWSGFMPVTAEDTMMPVFTIDVNSTAPMWFYCATGKHCQNGMVGVINPPANSTGRTIDAYKTSAKAAANNIAPSGQASGNSPTDTVSDPSNPEAPNAPTAPADGSGASSLAAGFAGALVAGLVSLALF